MSEKELKEIVAANIRKQLDKANLTQIELAERLNVSQSAVSAWAIGLKMPRTKVLDEMCKVFGCERSDILEDKSNPYSMTPSVQEYELIMLFKGLSVDGQTEILKYARLIAASPLYKKCDNIQEREA